MLEVRGIETYYGNIPALRGISIDVPEGSVVAIIGANGAGKTTLMKTIAGVLRPRSGSVSFLGEEITGLPSHKIVRRGVALVPEGRAILSRMTVRENLEMGAFTRRDAEKASLDMDRVMERFPVLKERAGQLGGSLSGGEQQMLAIARALMSAPKLLLLDEPTLGLAPLVVADIFSIIREINAAGTTILLVEQNVKQALKVSGYAYVLETGKIALSGPVQGAAPGTADKGVVPGAVRRACGLWARDTPSLHPGLHQVCPLKAPAPRSDSPLPYHTLHRSLGGWCRWYRVTLVGARNGGVAAGGGAQ